MLRFLGALAFATATVSPAIAQSEFYAGKTVTIYVAAGEGGAYSLYAQLAAEYLRKLVPGRPTVIVQSLPGAGRLRPPEYLQNVAAKDGTALGMLLDLVAVAQMLHPRTIKYDIARFSVIGSVVTDNPVVMVRSDAGVSKFEDLKSKDVVAGTSGAGSQTYINPVLLKEVLGARI